MGEKLEIAVVKGKNISEAQNLYLRHEKEGIPYVELRKGKKYGEIWFETPCDISFNPKQAFDLREWYESYWLERMTCKGLHPHRFSIGPTAVWFKFTLDDMELVKKQLLKLSWGQESCDSCNRPTIRANSERIFWDYAEKYFKKSKSMRRKRGEKVDMSDWEMKIQKR